MQFAIGLKTFAIGQKHLQFAIGQKTLVICNVFPPAIEKMFRFKVHEKCLEMSIFVFRLQLRKGLDAKYMKMFSCKVHEKQTTECAEQCRANLQKINSVNLHTAAVACSGSTGLP